ncbi:MAG TPA: metal ABC transporter ATP-binding protein [Mycobacteriales bacterium]|nr:metal ABC transporter ATP-binding protein [Mycobacteriales bacterium]
MADHDAAVSLRSAVSLHGATLRFGDRVLWDGLDLEVRRGELLAVLGPNGAGKTSLIRVLLGLQRLTAGEVVVNARPPRRGDHAIGYVPQQKGFDRDLPLRGTDLVRLGLDGHRWGPVWPSREARQRVAAAIDAVGASHYADAPLGSLSGGEQQRLRIAQALLADPAVLLCDEPLLSLDLGHQQAVMTLIDRHRREHDSAVLLVTHEINPILPLVDRVLYLVGGRWTVGTPDEVMTTERLTDLYGAPVDVLRVRDRIIVVGAADLEHDHLSGGHHHVEDESRPRRGML